MNPDQARELLSNGRARWSGAEFIVTQAASAEDAAVLHAVTGIPNPHPAPAEPAPFVDPGMTTTASIRRSPPASPTSFTAPAPSSAPDKKDDDDTGSKK